MEKKKMGGFITNLRSIFHRRPSSSAQLETSHYQHGIPGIPTDGKVVLLKNSSNGALLYLIGTVHGSVQGAETVKEVIDYVRPDVVAVGYAPYGVVDHDSLKDSIKGLAALQIFFVGTAIRTLQFGIVELCKERAMAIMEWKPEDDTSLYMLFRRSMRAAGGLCMKFVIFIESCRERRSHANGIFPGLEFKVAIEESSRVGARCFYIDQDMDVTLQQLCKVSTFYWLWSAYSTGVRGEVKYTRSFVQEMHSFQKELSPEIFKAMIEDRDKFMFTNLRSFQGKVVAAVGMGHMDGIELLWKQEEEDDNSSVFITVIEGGHGHSE
ncbi:hypothetical protein C5167_009746 [Papaver somniferum]|uniref:TraB family protein n=1 Tax=Papaver somniferum TaxID=3469 RepID=A0A4Y7K159_PAPSO|nr:hypothetical protein C5167_009746 [Papaver somniferum]